jgi:hypothetical protein
MPPTTKNRQAPDGLPVFLHPFSGIQLPFTGFEFSVSDVAFISLPYMQIKFIFAPIYINIGSAWKFGRGLLWLNIYIS